MTTWQHRNLTLDQSDLEFLEEMARRLCLGRHGFSTALRLVVQQWHAGRKLSRCPAERPAVIQAVSKHVRLDPQTYAILQELAAARGLGPKGLSAAVRLVVREWQMAQTDKPGTLPVRMRAAARGKERA